VKFKKPRKMGATGIEYWEKAIKMCGGEAEKMKGGKGKDQGRE